MRSKVQLLCTCSPRSGEPSGAYPERSLIPRTVLLYSPPLSHFMPRSQRPKQERETSVGKTATLHSFFGSTTQSTPIRAPSRSAEIIIIDSGDENAETSPTQSKRKALKGPDTGGPSSGSKKGKHFHNTARLLVPEDDSPLKSVPSSSLNYSVGIVEGGLYTT